MADQIVTIENVSLKYKKTVLTDVTISAGRGEVIGLLGLNGSGKSTLLSAIAGLRRTSKGTIKVGGKAGFVTQENALIDELTAMDNLKMWTPLSRAEILKELTETEGFANDYGNKPDKEKFGDLGGMCVASDESTEGLYDMFFVRGGEIDSYIQLEITKPSNAE